MNDPAPAELPLAIDRVHGSRPSAGEVRLVLSGAWQGPRGEADHEPLLVVQVEGRRHRFPADRDDHAGELPEGRWRATFSVPDWAEPRREGQAAVWVGNAVVPVPPLHGSQNGPPTIPDPGTARPAPRPAPPAQGDALAASEPSPEGLEPEDRAEADGDKGRGQASAEGYARASAHGPGRSAEGPAGAHGGSAEPAPSRSGPLADPLLRETVAALRGELEQRMADLARLREVTAAQEQRMAELTAARDRELAELRAMASVREDALRGAREEAAIAGSRAERRDAESSALREELAASHATREAALSELAGLRAELHRVGAELAVTRERVASESGHLGQANRLLAEAKTLAEEIRRGRDD